MPELDNFRFSIYRTPTRYDEWEEFRLEQEEEGRERLAAEQRRLEEEEWEDE